MIGELIEKLEKALPGAHAIAVGFLGSNTLESFKQSLDILAENGYCDTSGLLTLLADREADPALRVAACRVLAFIKDERVRPALEAVLINTSLELAITACDSLGTQGDKRATWALLRIFRNRDNSLDLRRGVIISLGNLRSKSTVRYFLMALQDQEPQEIRESIASNIGRFGDERALEPLIKIVENTDEAVNIRRNAVWSLSDFKGDRTVNVLLQLLQKEAREEVRAAAANGLGWIGDARAIDPLLEKLIQPDESIKVRSNAAHSLGLLGDTRATAPLVELLRHEDPEMRYSAANALGNLGDAEAIPALEWVVAHDHTVLDQWRNIRETAEWAIDYIQTGGG